MFSSILSISSLSGTPNVGETWEVQLDDVGTPYRHTLTTAQNLDDVGAALAALDGNASGGAATYDAASDKLTISGLAGKSVAFAVSGVQPNGTAVISGTPAQTGPANATQGTATAAEQDSFTQAILQFGGVPKHNQTWTITLTDSQGTVRTSTSVVGPDGRCGQ